MPNKEGNSDSRSSKLAALGVLGDNDEMPTSYENLQFNPNVLTVVTANNYQDQTAFGAATPVKQYTGAKTRTLTAQFFFDTSGSDEDVRDRMKSAMDMLAKRGAALAPPVCVFVYGAFMFVGVVESATQKFLMFSSDGKPIRATIDITLSEYKSMSGKSLFSPQENTNKTMTKTEGEELHQIAAKEYGDSAMWRDIAKENGIQNPRVIPAGIQLNVKLNAKLDAKPASKRPAGFPN